MTSLFMAFNRNRAIPRPVHNLPRFGMAPQQEHSLDDAGTIYVVTDIPASYDGDTIEVGIKRRTTRQSMTDATGEIIEVTPPDTQPDSFSYAGGSAMSSNIPVVKTTKECKDPADIAIKHLKRGQVAQAKQAFIDKGGDPADAALFVEIYNETKGHLKDMAEFYAKKEARLRQSQVAAKKAEAEQRIISALQTQSSAQAQGLFRRLQTNRRLPLFTEDDLNGPKDFQELWDVFVAKERQLSSMAEFREEKEKDICRKQDEQKVLTLLDQGKIARAKKQFLALTYGTQRFREDEFEDLEFEHEQGGLTEMSKFYEQKIINDLQALNYEDARRAFKALAGKAYSPINWVQLREDYDPKKKLKISSYLHTPLNVYDFD